MLQFTVLMKEMCKGGLSSFTTGQIFSPVASWKHINHCLLCFRWNKMSGLHAERTVQRFSMFWTINSKSLVYICAKPCSKVQVCCKWVTFFSGMMSVWSSGSWLSFFNVRFHKHDEEKHTLAAVLSFNDWKANTSNIHCKEVLISGECRVSFCAIWLHGGEQITQKLHRMLWNTGIGTVNIQDLLMAQNMKSTVLWSKSQTATWLSE